MNSTTSFQRKSYKTKNAWSMFLFNDNYRFPGSCRSLLYIFKNRSCLNILSMWDYITIITVLLFPLFMFPYSGFMLIALIYLIIMQMHTTDSMFFTALKYWASHHLSVVSMSYFMHLYLGYQQWGYKKVTCLT